MSVKRRVFLEAAEVPKLIRASLLGEPVALRRILGARRAGRVGLALALAGAALAAPVAQLPALIAAHAIASAAGATWAGGSTRVGPLQHQKLALWLTGSLWLAIAPLRLFNWESTVPAALALAFAHLLLWRHLQRGLG